MHIPDGFFPSFDLSLFKFRALSVSISTPHAATGTRDGVNSFATSIHAEQYPFVRVSILHAESSRLFLSFSLIISWFIWLIIWRSELRFSILSSANLR